MIMNQYCRYCNSLVTGNGTYCEAHERELSDSYAKGINHCKDFEFNPMDAYGENEKGYMPRPKKRNDGKQIRMEDLINGITP